MLQDGTEKSQEVTGREFRSDESLLATLGYKQEFRRIFSPVEVFGVGFGIIGLLPSLASVLFFSIPNGGAVAMVWGWTVCTVFLVTIALAIAELGSIAPTSGGLYYWTFMFSSPKWRCLLSWIVGYSSTIAYIAGVAAIDWGCAVQIMAAASIGSGLKFSATTGQTYAVLAGLLILHAIVCSLNTRITARLQVPFIIANILLCLVIIIGVPAATPKQLRNDASYAFGNFQNFSGWPDGFAFVLSFLTPLWTVGGFDTTVHMSEEALNAATAIPWAIIIATTSSGILGWAINVALAFCMGTDLEGIINSPIGQPMATILFNSFGQKGTLAFWALIIVLQFTMGINMLTACSRLIFAFARDGGLPFSRWLYKLDPRSHAPVNCVWFTAFLALLFGLLSFAGSTAISAVFSMGVVAQYLAYSITITSRFLGKQEIKPGPFSLGTFSLPVAAVAVSWMVFTMIVFLFPPSPDPKPASANYTVLVLGSALVFSVAYFYFPVYGGVHWFTGPVRTIKDSPTSIQELSPKSGIESSQH